MGSVKEAAMEEQQPLLKEKKKTKSKSKSKNKNNNKNKARRQQGQGYGSTPDQVEDSEEVEEDSQSQRDGREDEGNSSQQVEVEEMEVEESQWQRVGKVLRESPPEFFFGLFLFFLATYGHYSNARYGKEGVPYKLACYLSQQLFNKSTKDDFVPDEL